MYKVKPTRTLRLMWIGCHTCHFMGWGLFALGMVLALTSLGADSGLGSGGLWVALLPAVASSAVLLFKPQLEIKTGLIEARARITTLESELKYRDERVADYRAEVERMAAGIAYREKSLAERDEMIRDLKRELARFRPDADLPPNPRPV